MPHVSKNKLKSSHLNKLYAELAKTIVRLDTKNANLFLNELLGEEEKVMIAKRFTAIVMLLEENSTYRIAQLLLMSRSTVAGLRKKLLLGEYESIAYIVKRRKKEYADFWDTLEVILRAGLPPRGKGRWKSTLELLRKP